MIQQLFEKLSWNEPERFPARNFFINHKKMYEYLYLEPLRMPARLRAQQPYNFLEEDWDHCIVLDACRADAFKNILPVFADYETIYGQRISPASSTTDWIKRCLNQSHDDMVLVTANPKLSEYKIKEYTGRNKFFYHNEPVWKYGWDALNEGGLPTVKPHVMLDIYERKIRRTFSDKRTLTWLLQPHYPFIPSNSFKQGLKLEDWDRMNEARGDYLRNLIHTAPLLLHLLAKMQGKVLITADHGEAFGECFLFEHPSNIHIPALTEVPHLEVWI